MYLNYVLKGFHGWESDADIKTKTWRRWRCATSIRL